MSSFRTFALLLSLGMAFSAVAQEPQKPLKALLVVGGCCHDYAAQQSIIAKGLELRANIQVDVVHQGGTASDAKIELYQKPDWAKGYDVVLHDECFAAVSDKTWVDGILQPHREGLPGVVIHCAMHCYRTGADDWFEFCGVTSHRHGAHYPHEVLNRDGEHPVMKLFGPAWANPAGELYHIEKVWPSAHPLASAKNREDGKEEVCVWTNQYRGKTRVFGTTLGHHNETVRSDEFLDLLTRGTLWACNKLDDTYLKPRLPVQVPVNLAQGKPATASSEETGKNNFARNAVDGNPQTRWCPAGPETKEWLQVDLGKAQSLHGARIYWEGGGVYRYRLDGSTNGQEWRTLVDGSNNQQAGEVQPEFTADNIRYVKVTFLGCDQGGWGSIWELELHGKESRTLDPAQPRAELDKKLEGKIKTPEGFAKTVFAAPPAGMYPVFVAASPTGELYVSMDKNGSLGREPRYGAIYRMRDVDGDGRADETKLFVPNVDSPRGLAWDHDRLYVLHPPHVSAFIDRDADGICDEEQVLVKNIAFTFKDRPADHTSNGLTMGIDGWLYLAIGDFGFMEAEGTDGRKLQLRGGGVVRVRPDGTGLELYSRGTRNILKVAVDPLLNGFSRDNTNDGGGWDIRLHHYTGMEHHGYPSLFKNFGDEIVQPLADYGGGSGCGGLWLDEPGFPASFGRGLYTCDWGRGWVFHHPLTPNGATFKPEQKEFVNVPRVTDMDVDASSHLYVSSWKDGGFAFSTDKVGFIARVTPSDYKPTPLPDVSKSTDAELVKLLETDSHRRRLLAQRMLLQRGLKEPTVAALRELAGRDSALLESRVAAIFTLKQGLGERATPLLVALAQQEKIREWALRAMADRLEENNAVPTEPFVKALTDKNPRVRNAALIGLARLGKSEPTRAMTDLLGDEDPIVRHTAVQTLIALKAVDACFGVLDSSGTSSAVRAGAIQVVQALHQPEVVEGLIARLAKEQDASRRLGYFIALCRLHFIDGEWKGNSWGTRPDTSGPYYQPETWKESEKILKALATAVEHSPADQAAALLQQLNRHKVQISGSLEKLVSLAKNDAALLPALADEVDRSGQLPAAAAPLLMNVATQADTSPATRAQAIRALVRGNSTDELTAALQGLNLLQQKPQTRAELQRARDAWLTAPKNEARVGWLIDLAALEKSDLAPWADAALLKLASAKDTSVEVKTQAKGAIEKGWQQPARKLQLLTAIGLAEDRSYADRLFEAEHSGDEKAQSLAKQIIKQLNLEVKKSNGPLIETLEIANVVEQVVKTKGKATDGMQIFQRLECAKCHTVKAEETPRGPFLGTIANTYKRKDLAEAILMPSKTLAQGFVTNHVVTDDGKQYTGFVTLEAADKLVLRNAEGKEIEIPTASIEERTKLTTSVMPEGLVKKLTVEELASLVDYLESLPKK